MNEAKFRKFLYKKHKSSIIELVDRSHEHFAVSGDEFPNISNLLRVRTERKINNLVNRLEELTINGKEVRLVRKNDSTTRIDLLGRLQEDGGLVIIELKKSHQSERQAFNELLAYANHFCTLFPSLTESSILSLLVAPMEGRGIRDAVAQELIINNKNILALQPYFQCDKVILKPYYPNELYYVWMKNQMLSDDCFTVVVASFPIINGWIDSGKTEPPAYTKKAFQIITKTIAQKAEKESLSGFVYARQHWEEIAQEFPYPNSIILCLMNPFSQLEIDDQKNLVFGDTNKDRIKEIQTLVDQLDTSDEWMEGLQSSLAGQGIRIIQESFGEIFGSNQNESSNYEISLPNWKIFKASNIESVYCHNLSTTSFGLINFVLNEYAQFCYDRKFDDIYYADDLPKFPYLTKESFLATWELICELSKVEKDS